MSGICGIVRFDGQSVKKEEIQNMLNVMQNRGNDTEEVWVDGNVGFGHKMFWTTKESLSENQPLVSQDKKLVLTADVRIDNREELIEKLEINEDDYGVITDSYLILMSYEKWQEECPKYLIGDFAFAIFDKITKKLFFARDHIGIRPFYYYIDKNFFCFSSEISVIFSINTIKKLRNGSAIKIFIEDITLEYEDTFFKDIKRLPPGHKIMLDAGAISSSRYWFPEEIKINKEISFEEATKKFKNLLQKAISVRLRSIYPIGCELSGGLDSSSILCLSSNMSQGKDITSFSQRYGELECDESYYSDLVAESLGVDVQTIRVDKLDYNEKYSLENYMLSFPDWPTCGHFMGHLAVAKKAKEQNIRILLTGQGGDHIVAGNLYILADYLKTFQFIKLYKELDYYRWSKNIIKHYVIKPVLPKFLFKVRDFLTFKKRKYIISPNNFFENSDSYMKSSSFAFNTDLDYIISTHNAWWTDSNIYHNMERFNIESRHPYFDVRLVEFCLSLPEEYKLQYGISKRVLKEAMIGILPEPVRCRNDKAEFSEPVKMQLVAEGTKDVKADIINISALDLSARLGIEKWNKRNFKVKKEINEK